MKFTIEVNNVNELIEFFKMQPTAAPKAEDYRIPKIDMAELVKKAQEAPIEIPTEETPTPQQNDVSIKEFAALVHKDYSTIARHVQFGNLPHIGNSKRLPMPLALNVYNKKYGPEAKNKPGTFIRTPYNPDEKFVAYKKDIVGIIKTANKPVAQTLQQAYRKLNADYGVVFAQIQKEYFNEHEHYANTTLEVVWYNEQTHEEFKGLLADIVEDICNAR